jgi:hypothetical protein
MCLLALLLSTTCTHIYTLYLSTYISTGYESTVTWSVGDPEPGDKFVIQILDNMVSLFIVSRLLDSMVSLLTIKLFSHPDILDNMVSCDRSVFVASLHSLHPVLFIVFRFMVRLHSAPSAALVGALTSHPPQRVKRVCQSMKSNRAVPGRQMRSVLARICPPMRGLSSLYGSW